METGSSSKPQAGKERNDALGKIEPFMARPDHNPKELKSWAKRTGFVSTFSSETGTTNNSNQFDIEKGLPNQRNWGTTSPAIEIDPVPGRSNRGTANIEPASASTSRTRDESSLGAKDEEIRIGENGNKYENGDGDEFSQGNGKTPVSSPPLPDKEEYNGGNEVGIDKYPGGEESAHRPIELTCGLRENPGFVAQIFYGLQHFLSLAGSLIFIPLIMVPAMGGTDKDTATVISTMLLVSGFTTILHSYFGTRLPLVQGSSFVYLAPALVVINAREFRNLSGNKFRHIMRELQGAIIIGSVFQTIMGLTGLMSIILRFINPVVVAPTVAVVGFAFFSFGFPQAGSCFEISIPQILLVLIFTLYLRGVSIFGLHLFRVYAVPLSVMITWIYAFFLTTGGAYDFKDCSPDIPSSNILIDSCRNHSYTMKHCRTDVSNAWASAAWVRIPYPLQWGVPVFHLRTSIIMIIVSLVASVDSVGTYYSASLLVTSNQPTPGIVSRGIGLEGFCGILAGIWGSGTGSTTLTENVHTINITKMANRRAVEIGATFLILFSFVGKIGAILASIPQALAAGILCFMWALTVALGLSNLRYAQAASFRNITIVGVSLFLGLSIPAYFQQYDPETTLILPGYFVSYAAASSGPLHTGSKQVDFAINGLLSLNMVVTLLVALILDNTVPGSGEERGVYIWSNAEDLATDQSSKADYSLPPKVSRFFCLAT